MIDIIAGKFLKLSEGNELAIEVFSHAGITASLFAPAKPFS